MSRTPSPFAVDFPWTDRASDLPRVLFFGPPDQSLLAGFAKASGHPIKGTDLVPRRSQPYPRTTVMALAGAAEVYVMHASFFWKQYGAEHPRVAELLGATAAAVLGLIRFGDEDALEALRIAHHVGLSRVLGWVGSAAEEPALRDALAAIDAQWRDAPVVVGSLTKKKEAAASFARLLEAAGEHLASSPAEPERVIVPLEVVTYGMRPGEKKAMCHHHTRVEVGQRMDALTWNGSHPIAVSELQDNGFLFQLPGISAKDVLAFAPPGTVRPASDARIRTAGAVRGTDGSLYAFGHPFFSCHLESGQLTLKDDVFRKREGLIVSEGAPVVIVHGTTPLVATLGFFG